MCLRTLCQHYSKSMVRLDINTFVQVGHANVQPLLLGWTYVCKIWNIKDIKNQNSEWLEIWEIKDLKDQRPERSEFWKIRDLRDQSSERSKILEIWDIWLTWYLRSEGFWFLSDRQTEKWYFEYFTADYFLALNKQYEKSEK